MQTDSIIDNEVGHGDPTPQIPQSFIDTCVWTHSQLDGMKSPWHPWVFNDDMLSDAHSVVADAFQCAKSTRQDKGHREQATTLFSPYHGGHAVVDAIVKIVAQKAGADVLVLDGLDLASGRFGPLGDGASVINSLYEKLPIKTFDDAGDTERFFDRLVSVGTDASTKRRIIYMKEFESIAQAAVPLMIYLLRAIDRLRATTSVILVLGASRRLGRAGDPSDYDHLPPVYQHTGIPQSYSNELRKGDIPCVVMPDICAEVGRCRGLPSISLSAHFFGSVFYSRPDYDALTVSEDPPPANFDGVSGDANKTNDEGKTPDGTPSASSLPISKDLDEVKDPDDQMLGSATPGNEDSNLEVEAYSLNFQQEEVPSWWQKRVQSLMQNQKLRLAVYPEDIQLQHQRAAIDERIAVASDVLCNLILKERGIVLKGERASFLELAKPKGHSATITENHSLVYSLASPWFFDDDFFKFLDCDSECKEPVAFTLRELYDSIEAHTKRGERVKKWVDRELQRLSSPPKSSNDKVEDKVEEEAPETDRVIDQVRKCDDLTEHEERLLPCIVDANSLSTSFEDVILDKRIVQGLRSMVSLPLHHPQHFRTGILSREALTGALLYGPPGTGKTMVCRALARESGARMILIKPSDVFDMWLGESEKLAKAVFSLAHRLAPCVVFIDEVDAIFGARSSSQNGRTDVHRAMLTEFMQCMDGLYSGPSNEDKGVVVIGATNRPYDLDQAILRRLPCRMLVDLPAEAERESILKSHLKGEELDGLDLQEVAANTESYSGSDLKNLCVSAAMEALRDSLGDLVFELTQVENEKPEMSTENSGSLNDGQQTESSTRSSEGERQVGSTKKATIPKRIIKMEHFSRAYTQVTASFTFEGNKQLYDWHEKHGSNAEVSTSARNRSKVAQDRGAELRIRKDVEPVAILEQPLGVQELGKIIMGLAAVFGGVRPSCSLS